MATEGEPVPVKQHDFMDKELGKAIPYGVYDLMQNKGWVSVGVDHETASLAVETIRQWWYQMGQSDYPQAMVINYCRLWWQQQLSQSLVEMGTATTGN